MRRFRFPPGACPTSRGRRTASIGRGGERTAPLLAPQCPQSRSGDEVALEVEGVVDGGVDGEESLCRAGRFEALHLALAPPHDLMRVFSTIIHPRPLFMTAGQA